MPELPNKAESLERVPFGRSFSGHETFALRHAWLKKGFDAAVGDPEVFQADDALVRLGVGKNMVRAIRYWCLSARILAEEDGSRGRVLRPTELGTRLLTDDGWDPYLEDEATLWLIHWNLASRGARSFTWYYTFNRFHELSFSRAVLTRNLRRAVETLGWEDVSDSTLERDVDCLIHTYAGSQSSRASSDEAIECPLTGLGLLRYEGDGEHLRFGTVSGITLPPAVFAYALLDFWRQARPDAEALEVRELSVAEGSPALVFRLDQDSLLAYLDGLSDLTSGSIVFQDTALVRRVVRTRSQLPNACEILQKYYV
jgi:hypothetical protein